jgi:3-hydroxymyristoyl/3-hydroxydecanoyl-(acyl carrier protein) dehydratase
MTTNPLIAGFTPDALLGVQDDRTLAAGEFIAAANLLARRIPEHACGLLLCDDRLRFALGFAAMLLRESTALLPPSRATRAIERIVGLRAPSFALVDRAGVAPGLPEIVVEPWTQVASTGEVPTIADEHVAAVVYTSGTTGDPQPHIKTWSSLARGAAGLRERIAFRAGDGIVGAVPAQHMWGLEATVMLALQGGGIVHAGVPLLPHDIGAALAQLSGRRWLVLTPLHVRSCVQSNVPLPPLTGVLTATSALERDLAQRFERVTGAPTIEIYGSSETGVIGTRRPALESAFTPLKGLSVESHADGLLLRGAQLEADVQLRDRAVVAPDGRFTLAGRDADLVKVGGKRASLAMLRHELLAIDGVVDGAFVVLDARGLTPRLAALAVAPALDAPRIMAALRERVDAVFLPRPLHLVDTLPRDALGKLPVEAMRRRIEELSGARLVGTESGNAHVREYIVPATHPALPGHFPGRPIVPAAWLLTLVAAACREAWNCAPASMQLDNARFRAPLAPEMTLRVRLDRHANGRIAFTCTSGQTRVADGAMTMIGAGVGPGETLGPRLRGDDADASPSRGRRPGK